MKKNLFPSLVCTSLLLLGQKQSMAQINLLQDYKNNRSATIGTFQGISFREAGFSGLYAVPNTNGKEFWTCSDRGVNVDGANANPATCRPTYDKIYGFPNYAPKIHRIRLNGDSVQILQTITMKRPGGTNATGILNPTGFGSTATEQASTDTVLDCNNFNAKIAAKDIWGIDAEGIVVDKQGYFWICEEGGPTIWKLNPNGVVVKRFTPYANLAGAQSIDVQIDTVFKYRKNNRGFEGIAITPNGKIYAAIQSPLLYPTTAVGEATRVHRILEIDPQTNATRVLVYLNDGIIGTGANQIRTRDWKLGDMAAINDSTFLVLEAAARGTTDIKRVYKINITGATPVTAGLYGTATAEGLVDSAGLAANSITPVKKTLMMDLLANGWPAALDKAEGLAIVNDSTIFICNDNDYGQNSPGETGIAAATTNISHVIKYGLRGVNKLSNFKPLDHEQSYGITGPSTASAPYLTPAAPGVTFTSIITAGEVVNGYKMCGIPDGLGAYDNGNGTFTLLMNHEMGNTSGVARAHGSAGAFVSKWIINKSDLSVVSGGDLIQRLNLWNTTTNSYTTYNAAFPSASAALNRFCSADLPEVSAFYNSATGKGTRERIFMNGEESGNEGRGIAHIATGPNAGTSYELPALGKYSWENSVACPTSGDSTVVIGLDDATPGQVYVYVGAKTTSGTDIEKAGLTNGKLYGVKVTGLLTETNASIPAANTVFTLSGMGDVTNTTGGTLNTNSNNQGVTTFLRPEDGAWDPSSPNDFYFATTNAFTSPSRLWKLHFTDVTNPTLGGTITAVLDGTEGHKMIDNMGIDNYGHVMLVEDVGGNVHIGKIWQYDIATDVMTHVGSHDTTRFLSGSANYLTQDEEATGIIDVQGILGAGMFLVADQAHYGISGEVVEGGQLLAMYNPASFNANPEISMRGNNMEIVSGDVTPTVADNTDFGDVSRNRTSDKTFTIKNAGPGSLNLKNITFTGAQASEFTLVNAPAFPKTVAANDSQVITVRFAPLVAGTRTATINIANNDFDEANYNVALKGESVIPEINVRGNNISILNGDLTPGTTNNTDFGTVNINTTSTKTFTIQNTDRGILTVSGITFAGSNASEFTLTGAPAFPIDIAANDSQRVTVQFAPLAAGLRTATIRIANNDDNEPNYEFALQGLGKDPTSVSNVSNSASFARLYPNPTGDAATIALILKKEEHIVISIFNMEGKEVLKAVDGTFKAGDQQVVVNTATLANGTYFVQVASGSISTKIKMVVLH
jgi:hypothetical protein